MTIDEAMKEQGYERATVAATRLGLDRSTISRWAKDKKIRSKRSGLKFLYVHTADINAHAGIEDSDAD